jgi:hypothetical protein
LEIPEYIERGIGRAVAGHLKTELGDRSLLLGADELVPAGAEIVERGARLLNNVVNQCYLTSAPSGGAVAVEFEGEHVAARLQAALAFGAVTADVLGRGGDQSAPSVELLCAVFNLGIGLVDALCDGDPATGGRLLELIQERDLAAVVEARQPRGWLHSKLAAAPSRDAAVAFTVDIIEAFFEILHDAYPDDAGLQLRCGLGAQLSAALAAELQSVGRLAGQPTREQLIECSRLTSTLPFQVIQTLAGGKFVPTGVTAGTLLGEAVWRIDDLVDLCPDARSGALNGVLLTATGELGRPRCACDVLAALESLLDSADIADTAAKAAESLLTGLQRTDGGRAATADQMATRSFLYFIQRYAGLATCPMS